MAFRHLVQIRTRQRREQQERALVIAQRLEAKRDVERCENQSVWDAIEQSTGAYPATRYPRLVLPSGPRRLSNLPQRRRNRYRDHLNRIITAAVSGARVSDARPARDEPPVGGLQPMRAEQPGRDLRPAPPAGAAPLVGELCTLCGGGCCTRGGETAYLTAATIRRFMSLHPELRPRDVLAAYLDRLGARTETGSCVNHAASGCRLPREMRSDTCNNFYCAALSQWRTTCAGESRPRGALVIVRRQDAWSSDALDRDNGIVCVGAVTAGGISSLRVEPRPDADRRSVPIDEPAAR